MKYKIFQAVVIGSGTMGAAVAAHLANPTNCSLKKNRRD
jgi:3-hydroxyacyl-CoA dehydrogenase